MKRTEMSDSFWIFQRTLQAGNLVALLEVMEGCTSQRPSTGVVGRHARPASDLGRVRSVLACWLDLEQLFEDPALGKMGAASSYRTISTGLGRLREVIATAAYLSQWRGTAKGLLQFLETATGTHGFEIHEQVIGSDGNPRPFHFLVLAPEGTARHRVLIERIIELEKPAHVTYELAFGPRNPGGA
jgi:hypothetical protein